MNTRADVLCGDMREVLARLPSDAFGSVVTDPPYGLSFMSAGWDHDVPGPDHWREALRVAKPGAHLVAFGGTRTFHRLTCAIEDAGWEIRDCLSWLYGSGFPKSHNGEWGGTALKPAWEPIILARKPLTGTVAATFAAHGTGGLNVDGCRIGTESTRRPQVASAPAWAGAFAGGVRTNGSNCGRWPANVVLDEEAGALLDEQSGITSYPPSRAAKPHRAPASTSVARGALGASTRMLIADSGGASRFFYCAKASRRERGEGNTHPTVKPIALMRWLVRLVSPVGSIVIDPFAGSGSTLLAAVAEGRDALGIELDPRYVEIIRSRLAP